MVKIKLIGSHSKDTGCWAGIEDDVEDGYITIAGSRNTDVPTICANAAKRLRLLADRFELLAEEKDPFNRTTINKINRKKLK